MVCLKEWYSSHSTLSLSGTYSTVYKVQRDNGEYFACKRLRFCYVGHEWEILCNVAHASNFMLDLESIQFRPDCRPTDMVSMVMPLVDHPVAWSELTRMTLSQLKSFTKCVFGGLHDLHAHGYVHRDVKPSNMLCESLEPMKCFLIDFGLSTKVCVAI